MTINAANPFKSKTIKIFYKSKIGQDVRAGGCFPSADVNFYSGKKIFKFGSTSAVMDDNLLKPKPLEHVVVQSSLLFDVRTNISVERQKKIIFKIKSAKNNIAKLFKPNGRVSEAVTCIHPFAVPNVAPSTPNRLSSSLTSPSTLRHPKPNLVTAYGLVPPRHASSEAITSPIACGESVVEEHIDDLTSTICGLVGNSSPPQTAQLCAKPELQLDGLSSTFFLNGLHTIEEEDGSAGVVVGVVKTEQKELVISDPYISRSNSDSGVTVYLSGDTFSEHSTVHGVGLVSSETSLSLVDTSLATSVDAEDSHRLSPGMLRGLRRVPNYEDLRNSQIVANRGSPRSDISCGSSDCDSYGAASGSNAAPLRRSVKCYNLRKSFLSLEPSIYAPSIRQMNKYKQIPAWLNRRCHESSRNIQKTPAFRAPNEPQEVTSVFRSRQFLQGIIHPSSCVQEHAFKSSSSQSSLQSPFIWSCVKITQSSSKTKNHRRMTHRSMGELKARLNSMDIDHWY